MTIPPGSVIVLRSGAVLAYIAITMEPSEPCAIGGLPYQARSYILWPRDFHATTIERFAFKAEEVALINTHPPIEGSS